MNANAVVDQGQKDVGEKQKPAKMATDANEEIVAKGDKNFTQGIFFLF
jgi:hypothetical protein